MTEEQWELVGFALSHLQESLIISDCMTPNQKDKLLMDLDYTIGELAKIAGYDTPRGSLMIDQFFDGQAALKKAALNAS